MKTTNKLLCIIAFAGLAIAGGCNDKKYMDEESDSSMYHMRTWDDAQSVLDNTIIMQETPALTELSADDIYIPVDSFWKLQYPVEANTYLWLEDIFGNRKMVDDWFKPYQQVMYANAVLEAIPRLPATASPTQQQQIKGSALFIRSHAFFQIAVCFAGLYSPGTFDDPGIPLRQTTNPDTPSVRATIKESYDRITTDLKEACQFLPTVPDLMRKNRPSRPAAYALLSRVYLFMGDYLHAKLYADSCLQYYAILTDYNNLLSSASNPFATNKEEILYETNLLSTTDVLYRGQCYVDSILYSWYTNSDLRRQVYFTLNFLGNPIPRYSKTGNIFRFSGIAVDEVYLTRAECYARTGHISEAIQDLSTLLVKRYKKDSLPNIISDSLSLDLILKERRKELVFRGIRWMDIRRLNREKPSITLKRLAEGKEFILPAGDKRFLLPIPPGVIAINPDMPQNPRN